MRQPGFTARVFAATSALALAVAGLGAPAVAQQRPADLESLPPVPTDYQPERTPWGDPDISNSYQIEFVQNTRILFQRPAEYGNRFWQTDVEYARRVAAPSAPTATSPQANERGIGASGTQGTRRLVKTSDFAKRTSMLVSPANGQLPAFTAEGKRLHERAARAGSRHRVRLGQRFR